VVRRFIARELRRRGNRLWCGAMTARPVKAHRRRTRFLAALALLPLLSGCVAAVAIPLVAGGTLYAREHGVFVRAATPADSQRERGTEGSGRLASLPPALDGAPQVALTNLTELPPPTPFDLTRSSPWQPFLDYALAQGSALAGAERPESALLVTDGLLARPNRRPCVARFPAVVIDLDQAEAAFAPDSAMRPLPGLAAGLARLREAGIVVLWLSRLPAGRVGEVAGTLRASGLDPEGKDQFLLMRGNDDRKQVLREQASEDVCIVAIAGDQRSDFDELYDYLRDPNGAPGLEEMIGSGWFIVPPPLAPSAP
jgi:hypothetical protein